MRFFRQWIIVLFGLALLNANALGAHLHLCFDGQEPTSSLRVLDDRQNANDPSTSSPHRDVDVALTDEAIAKSATFNQSMAAPPSSPTPSPAISATFYFVPLDFGQPLASVARDLLPPKRGPPA